MFHPCLWG